MRKAVLKQSEQHDIHPGCVLLIQRSLKLTQSLRKTEIGCLSVNMRKGSDDYYFIESVEKVSGMLGNNLGTGYHSWHETILSNQ